MEYSQHTLIMSLLLFTLLAIIGGIIAHNASWKTLKLSGIIMFICIIRLLLPFEILGATVIRMGNFYSSINHWLSKEVFGIIRIIHLFFLIWIFGTIISLILLVFCLYKQWCFLQNCIISQNHSLYKLCSESSQKLGFSFKGTIRMSPKFSSPGMIGLLKPNIILPDNIESFPDEYIPYIFYHELYHFKGKDSWILLVFEILRCFLWWNPAIYFLKSGIEHMLELRCDKNVCSILKDNSEKRLYGDTLIFVAEQQIPTKRILISGYTGKKTKILLRFEEIFKKNKFQSNILKPCIAFISLLASIILFVLSYQFIIQPSFTPSLNEETDFEDHNSTDNTSSFILRLKDGSLMYFENNKHVSNITEDMLDKEPYFNVPIYDKN